MAGMPLDVRAEWFVLMWGDLIEPKLPGGNMARKRISSSDLIWMFHERLKEYGDHPFHGVSLAVVPDSNGEWTVVTSKRVPKREPDLAVRIRKIEKQLRQEYMLAGE